MGCGCGGAASTGPSEYEVIFASGERKTVTTEIDAKVLAAKNAGTWKKVK